MVRRLCGWTWSENQGDYVEWITDATEASENFFKQVGGTEWEKTAYVQKWRWAGHAVRRIDRRPFHNVVELPGGSRQRGRPKTVWEDSFVKSGRTIFLGSDWMETAIDRNAWRDWASIAVEAAWQRDVFVTDSVEQ